MRIYMHNLRSGRSFIPVFEHFIHEDTQPPFAPIRQWKSVFSKALHSWPILLNSGLKSPQSRARHGSEVPSVEGPKGVRGWPRGSPGGCPRMAQTGQNDWPGPITQEAMEGPRYPTPYDQWLGCHCACLWDHPGSWDHPWVQQCHPARHRAHGPPWTLPH